MTLQQNNVQISPTVENYTSDAGIECNSETRLTRLNLCKNCKNFTIRADNNTVCSETGCNISLMITYNFKQCPLEKW